jgi:hypothetical protein
MSFLGIDRNINSKTYNDALFDNIKTNTERTRLLQKLPIEPDTNLTVTYPDKGRIAYSDADVKIMYCDGFIWRLIGNGTVTQVNTGAGLTGGPITISGTISMLDTTVVPGSYTYASLTVNSRGQLTAASNGVAPVTAVAAGLGISITGAATTPTVSLANVPSLYIADWMQSNQNIGTGVNVILATSLDNAYQNNIGLYLVPGTGIYTAPLAGNYIIQVSVQSAATNENITVAYLSIRKTSGLATNKVICVSSKELCETGAFLSCSTVTSMSIGDTVNVVFNNSGPSTPTLTSSHVTISWFGL